ncbi:nitroreductase/quinone reductase family protein [Rhodococcus sp. P1Y]|uniref:nitroreductase/quinone reductase family protein n=1 Tax=Rhodococcus sp. P1Y TaxID=1302308 RepID=UPI000EB51DB0|nr:nitroreductase/quinone reductase family protein [Rhodococcus sp. P1Y]AYJ50672.1 nitroreductase family deazaflavin-dependent oxidoreductase [Rhodococcus sp. P1Y]
MHPISKAALMFRNRAAVALYRRSNGRLGGRSVGLPVLLLTVPGRKTGLSRTTPVIYLEHGSSYVVVGSAFGAKTDPDWVKNLVVAKSAVIRVGDREWEVSARIAVDEERDRLWHEVVMPALPVIAKHEEKSGRMFALGVLVRL